jgi:hypothetical protein
MERSHAFLELSTSVSVVLLHDLGREARGDLIDPALNFGRGRRLSRNFSGLEEQPGTT